jgi:hypothetical protein
MEYFFGNGDGGCLRECAAGNHKTAETDGKNRSHNLLLVVAAA